MGSSKSAGEAPVFASFRSLLFAPPLLVVVAAAAAHPGPFLLPMAVPRCSKAPSPRAAYIPPSFSVGVPICVRGLALAAGAMDPPRGFTCGLVAGESSWFRRRRASESVGLARARRRKERRGFASATGRRKGRRDFASAGGGEKGRHGFASAAGFGRGMSNARGIVFDLARLRFG